MITAQVFIEYQLDTKTSFGVRADNGERVFISSRMAKKYDLQEEDLKEFTLLPNTVSGAEDTPWKAVGLSVKEALQTAAVPEETPRVELAKLEDRIMEHFDDEDSQYPHKASELADALGVEDLLMQTTLTRMHSVGEIAKAQVWAKGTQDKASHVLWAPDVTWFAM